APSAARTGDLSIARLVGERTDPPILGVPESGKNAPQFPLHLGELRREHLPWSRQVHYDFGCHPSGPRLQGNNAIREIDGLPHRVSDEQDRLSRMLPDSLELLLQSSPRL